MFLTVLILVNDNLAAQAVSVHYGMTFTDPDMIISTWKAPYN